MKKYLYIGLFLLAAFEVLKVYLIMPMPGSQQWESIELAYFLHTYRWSFRIMFALLALYGLGDAFLRSGRPWLPVLMIVLTAIVLYTFNFSMTADEMFLPPVELTFKGRHENVLGDSTMVLAVVQHGEAKAYPIRYMVYHHQVRDTVGGNPCMVTYCSVCRTGRVFAPVVNGKHEHFRLVGMDHFNAMFEDETTRSWWRQATGEAVAGALKGKLLQEIESTQLSLNTFFNLYPFGVVMQPDKHTASGYDSLGKFERGLSEGDLTRTDSLSWQQKSWVLGVHHDGKSKAYDWQVLRRKKVIHDVVGNTPVLIVLSDDGQSFSVFQRPSTAHWFSVSNDTLRTSGAAFSFHGQSLTGTTSLPRLKASQEFWHSWQTFHPDTEVYRD